MTERRAAGFRRSLSFANGLFRRLPDIRTEFRQDLPRPQVHFIPYVLPVEEHRLHLLEADMQSCCVHSKNEG